MKLWILGSGTLRPHRDHGSPGFWLEVGEERILLDCGSGTLQTVERLGLPWQKVTQIVVSHFHTDHVADLGPFLFALKHGVAPPRVQALRILGPRGISAHLDALAGAFGDFILEPGFPLEVTEMRPGEVWSPPGWAFRLRGRATPHTESSLAFRFESEEGALGYTGDTGPDDGLGLFFEGCDVLVAECSNPDGSQAPNHLTPGALAAIAEVAKPRLLVSVHAYPPLDPLAVPDLVRGAGYLGRVLAGRDGVSVTWDQRGLAVRDPGA
jgi:ribonuclease BN (tRNA processing enzyme)